EHVELIRRRLHHEYRAVRRERLAGGPGFRDGRAEEIAAERYGLRRTGAGEVQDEGSGRIVRLRREKAVAELAQRLIDIGEPRALRGRRRIVDPECGEADPARLPQD